MTGFVPTLEGFSFRVEHPDGGELFLLGKRLKPFGFDWLADGAQPFDELPVRVNRIAYREFTRQPDLDFGEFKKRLATDVFGSADAVGGGRSALPPGSILRGSFLVFGVADGFRIVVPWKTGHGALNRTQIEAYRDRLPKIRGNRAALPRPAGRGGKSRPIASWIMGNWTEQDQRYLADHLR